MHLGGERHCESKLCCPRTQHNVPGQGLNPGTFRSGVEHTNHGPPRVPTLPPLLYRTRGNMISFVFFQEAKRNGILLTPSHPSLFQVPQFIYLLFVHVLALNGLLYRNKGNMISLILFHETKRMASCYSYCTPACLRFRNSLFPFARQLLEFTSDFNFIFYRCCERFRKWRENTRAPLYDRSNFA